MQSTTAAFLRRDSARPLILWERSVLQIGKLRIMERKTEYLQNRCKRNLSILKNIFGIRTTAVLLSRQTDCPTGRAVSAVSDISGTGASGRAVKFSVFTGFIPYPGLPEPVGDGLPQIIPAA